MTYQGIGGSIGRRFAVERTGIFASTLLALLLHAVLLLYYWPLTAPLASSNTAPVSVLEMFAVAPVPVQASVPVSAPAVEQTEPVAQKNVEYTESAAIEKISAQSKRSTRQPRRVASTVQHAAPAPSLASTSAPVRTPMSAKPAISTAPVLVKKPQFLVPPSQPVYPPVAHRRGQQGTVLLEILLSESGRQMQLSVVRSSGFQLLDDAAKVAVADWKLAPYRMNGVAVLSRVQVPVAFVIQ